LRGDAGVDRIDVNPAESGGQQRHHEGDRRPDRAVQIGQQRLFIDEIGDPEPEIESRHECSRRLNGSGFGARADAACQFMRLHG
jgi:hypothetical protein